MTDHRKLYPSRIRQMKDKEMRRIRRDIRRVRIEPEDEQPIGDAARGIVIAFAMSVPFWVLIGVLWAVSR